MRNKKVISITLIIISIFAGIISSANAIHNPDTAVLKAVQVAEKKTEPVITTKKVTETKSVAYSTKKYNTNKLAKGKTRVDKQGKEGKREIVYEITYKDGKEISKKVISDKVTVKPVDKVIVVGTYVAPKKTVKTTTRSSSSYYYNPYSSYYSSCPNGSYVNSYGNVVCRPSTRNNGTATAVCRDYTYSYSQHRSGTCSHHGGVMYWL